MPQATIISEDARTVDVEIADGRLLVAPDRLADALGWELKPQGLCRDEECVPVRDQAALFRGEDLDLSAVAAALRRPAVVDAEAGIAAVAMDAEGRRQARDELRAPSFVLEDLDGNPHRLEEWRGHKKLLAAFASW
ncbi:MAG TPA: hypothetical protein VG476_11145 [Acidimicrobiales bacterium]|nr:hypothetical protein [Acidimicrobiales bacterium]